MKVAIIAHAVALAGMPAMARPVSAQAAEPLTVFLDCRTRCESDYIRTEIAFVNWVRERTVADVHVLVTSQEAGAGGNAYTLAFMGQRLFAGRGDTLVYTSNPTTTSDEVRQGMTRTLAAGLVPFIARATGASGLRISMPREAGDAGSGSQTLPSADPWNAWVFEVGVSGNLSGEENYRNRSVNGEFTANRTTEEWKLVLESSYDYRSDRAIEVEYDDAGNVISSETYTNIQRNWGFEVAAVKSVTGHFSLGFRGATGSNTFRNQKLRTEVMAGAEYNIFPYTEATRRRLVVQGGGGVEGFSYRDTTIFGQIKETFPKYFAAVFYSTRQPWGSSNVRVEHRGYLNDASKQGTEISGDINVRIVRGLSLRVGGGYEWIHDQVYLPKGNRDIADVLLRRRALLTGFDYRANIGLTYTFGSIFNNIVNPRF